MSKTTRVFRSTAVVAILVAASCGSDSQAESSPASEIRDPPADCLSDKLSASGVWVDQPELGDPTEIADGIDIAIVANEGHGRAPSAIPIDSERALTLSAGADYPEAMARAPSGDGPDMVLAINNVGGVFPGPAFDVLADGRIFTWTVCDNAWVDSTKALLAWTRATVAHEVLSEIRAFVEITRSTDEGYELRSARATELEKLVLGEPTVTASSDRDAHD